MCMMMMHSMEEDGYNLIKHEWLVEETTECGEFGVVLNAVESAIVYKEIQNDGYEKE